MYTDADLPQPMPTRAARLAPPWVTWVLIAANVAFFVVHLVVPSLFDASLLVKQFTLDGVVIGTGVGHWWRPVTSAFTHASVAHLLLNMLALLWIGRVLESTVGHLRFSLVYAAGVVAGALGVLLVSPTTPTVGASGAVFAIAGATLALEWRQRVKLLPGLLPLMVINLVITFLVPDISVGAHVGGFIGGVLVGLLVSASRATATGLAVVVGAGLAAVIFAV